MSGTRSGDDARTPRRHPVTPSPLGRPSEPGSTPASSKSVAGRAPRTAGRPNAARARSTGPSRNPGGRSLSSRPATASRGRTAVPVEERGSSTWVRGAILVTILVVLAVNEGRYEEAAEQLAIFDELDAPADMANLVDGVRAEIEELA